MVKPVAGWGSNGVSVVAAADDIEPSLEAAFAVHGGPAIVERYVAGPLLTAEGFVAEGEGAGIGNRRVHPMPVHRLGFDIADDDHPRFALRDKALGGQQRAGNEALDDCRAAMDGESGPERRLDVVGRGHDRDPVAAPARDRLDHRRKPEPSQGIARRPARVRHDKFRLAQAGRLPQGAHAALVRHGQRDGRRRPRQSEVGRRPPQTQ